MRHESGWTASQFSYLRSYLQCEAITRSGLFRPPYGRMSRSQARAISERSLIVMWDVLTGDFDPRRSASDCLEASLRHLQMGSIAVLHDSEKAAPRTMGLLQGLLDHFDVQGMESVALAMPRM